MEKVTLNNSDYDMDVVVHYMDDDIREEIHARGIENDQQFVDAYAAAHLEKFGEEFEIN